jgi:hypothetical protein
VKTITRLEIEQWGGVRGLALDLHPGLNVLLGESGTGKTLSLRVLHIACSPREGREALLEAADGGVGRRATVWRHEQPTTVPAAEGETPDPSLPESLFLPACWQGIDLAAVGDPWAVGLGAALRAGSLSRQALVPVRPLMDLVRDAMGGETFPGDEGLVFRPERASEVPIAALGGGLARLARVHALLRNGGLGPGCLVLWDLPETGLALSLQHSLAKLLLGLAAQGGQLVIATHSYVLAKELSLIAEDVAAVRYHCLSADGPGAAVRSAESMELLDQNPPLEAHARLYDRSVRRALRGDGPA